MKLHTFLVPVALLVAGCGYKEGDVKGDSFEPEYLYEDPGCHIWTTGYTQEDEQRHEVRYDYSTNDSLILKTIQDAYERNQTVRLIAEYHEGPCEGWLIHHARTSE